MKLSLSALFAIAILVVVSACSGHEELKSPCVGVDGSPCERRNPQNNVV